MKKQIFAAAVFALLLSIAFTTNAQEHSVIQGGVLNGTAASLPKPAYPQIARAARVSGTVVVQVLIDEEGNVIEAVAISGHPLLKAAAVQAAKGAKFAPTLLQGKPVRVKGTINYNFITEMSWIEIGVELGRAEKSNTYVISASAMSSLRSKQFDTEGNELQELQAASIAFQYNEIPPVAKPNTSTKSTGIAVVGTRKETKPITSEEYIRRLSSVINSIQTGIMSDTVSSWYFSLGLIVGNAMENMKDDSAISQIIERLRNHSLNASSEVSEKIVSALHRLASYSNKSSFDENDKNEIKGLFREILSAPVQRF